MMNLMTIGGYKAIISYDSEMAMFRGDFVGLNGGADFYAKDIDGLQREGEISLRVFIEMCEKDGVPITKQASGKFVVRLPSQLHEEAAIAASAAGISLNALVEQAIRHEINA